MTTNSSIKVNPPGNELRWRHLEPVDRLTFLSTPGRKYGGVAQVSNLPYRRFPIGRRGMARHAEKVGVRRLEALRYSRLETGWKPALRYVNEFMPKGT